MQFILGLNGNNFGQDRNCLCRYNHSVTHTVIHMHYNQARFLAEVNECSFIVTWCLEPPYFDDSALR